MKYTYKTEIKPTKQQITKIKQNIGVCRWLYNHYITWNVHLNKMYKRGFLDERQKHFFTAIDFDKYINRKVKTKKEFAWIGECGSKARKKAIVNAEKAYVSFFKQLTGFPRFKKKYYNDVKLYYPKSNITDWVVARHKIKVPTFGYITLKEKGYIPVDAQVINGTISMKANRYYVTVLVERNKRLDIKPFGEAMSIYFSLEKFIIYGDGSSEYNINETIAVKKLKQKLIREQHRLKRQIKYKIRYHIAVKQPMANMLKTQQRIQVIYQRLNYIRNDYIHKIIAKIIAKRPQYILLEDIKVSTLLKNKYLAEQIKQQKFFYFKARLIAKCKLYGIEVRLIQ